MNHQQSTKRIERMHRGAMFLKIGIAVAATALVIWGMGEFWGWITLEVAYL